jgi:tetratricopeptide (TPR) repeat protein
MSLRSPARPPNALALACLAAVGLLAAAGCSTAPKRPTEVVERKERAAQYAAAGNARYARADYRQALTLFRLALNENLAVDHLPGIAASYNSLGQTHLALGELEQAERYFREAQRLAEELSDPRLQARSASNLAEIRLARGQAAEAEQLLRSALTRLPAGDPGPEQAILLHNLGAVLKARQRLPEALDCFQQALALNLRHERFEEAASNYFMIASLQSKQGDPGAAIASLQEALRCDRLMERSLGIAEDQAALGLLYRRLGREQEALEAYRRSLQVYQSLSLAAQARRLLPALIELAERAGYAGEAQTYRQLASELAADPAADPAAEPAAEPVGP